MPKRSCVVPLLALAAHGCGFGPECSEIVLRMPATVERGGVTTAVDLHGVTYSYSIFPSPEPYEQAYAFLIGGGVASTSAAVAWSFRGEGMGGVMGLRGPQEAGSVVAVSTGAFQRISADIGDPRWWGPTRLSGSGAAEAILEAPDFEASQASGGNVSGMLTVLAIRPLRLLVDLLGTDAAGEELRLRGEMSFEAVSAVCP